MVIKVSNYVDNYRVKARYARDVHQLDGRNGRRALTEFTNHNILNVLNLSKTDELIDIGCGDGCLLQMAEARGISNTCGLTASEEEAARLHALGLKVRAGLTDALPLADCSASVVVCNSVLLIVPRTRISASLSEIARVAKPGARIYIGEIPRTPELAGVPRHETVASMLLYLFRKHGLRTFLGMGRRIAWTSLRGEPTILNSAPATEFYIEPDEFIPMAAGYGLRIERYFAHRDLDKHGNERISGTRVNYLFTRVSSLNSALSA